MAFPLLTTTTDIINVLSGANDAPQGKKLTTSMKLYVRERGQGESLNLLSPPVLTMIRSNARSGREAIGYTGPPPSTSGVHRC